jgi:hypothetical protein
MALRTTIAHLTDLEHHTGSGGLQGRTAPFPGAGIGALIADRMEVAGVAMKVGDFVTFGEDVGIIAACAVEGCDLYAVVRGLQKQGDLTNSVGRYTESGTLAVWQASVCAPCVAWRDRADGSHVVVRR